MVETFTPKSESDLAWFVSQGWTVSVAELFSLHNKETFPSHVFPMSTWIPLFPLLCFLLTRLAKTDTKLAALLLKLHSLNKDGLGPSCTWTKCIKASSWCFKGSPSSALTETCTTSPFNASFNAFSLDVVMGSFGICNGSLVFVGWFTSSLLTSKWFDLKSKLVSNKVRSTTLKVTLITSYSLGRSTL